MSHNYSFGDWTISGHRCPGCGYELYENEGDIVGSHRAGCKYIPLTEQHYIVELEAENNRLADAYVKTSNEVEQVLAQALGNYPWYKDDPENFPGATEHNGVCIGDHTPETLAQEAARHILSLEKQLQSALAKLHKERLLWPRTTGSLKKELLEVREQLQSARAALAKERRGD